MVGPLIVAHLHTAGGKLREECIQRLTFASKYALEKEPGVLKYACLVSQDPADDKSVYAIEEYADKAAFDSHMATPHVADMISWMGIVPLLEGAPTIYQLEFIPGFDFSKPQTSKHSNPHVIFATLDYKPDAVSTSLPYWKAVIETSKNDEPGTLVYGICRDEKEKDKLYTLEAYESKEYLMDVHVKSAAIADSIENTKHLRNGLSHAFLKLQSGYLYKEATEVMIAQL